MIDLEAGIVVADVARATEFYAQGFGFEIVTQLEFPQGKVTRLSRGSARIKLYEPALPPTVGRQPANWRTTAGFAYAALHVPDAATALRAAVAAGATELEPVTHHRPGACYAMIADPDGNVWELLQENE